MVMIGEALEAEREKRKRETEETVTQREVGRAVLQALAQRLTADPVPTWFFMLSDDEVIVLRITNGASARERVGSWVVDQEMKLVFGPHTTEWITAESWSRVVDEAVQITAQVIVDAETREAHPPSFASRIRSNTQQSPGRLRPRLCCFAVPTAAGSAPSVEPR